VPKIGELFIEIGARTEDLEQQLSKFQKELKKFARPFGDIGKNLTRAITLPLAGIATIAFRSSEKATAIFREFGERVKAIMGKLGDQLSESLQLESFLKGVSDGLSSAVEGFSNLSPAVQKALAMTGLFAATLGPLAIVVNKVVLAIGSLATGFGLLIKLLAGPAGLVFLLVSAAAALVGFFAAKRGGATTDRNWRDSLTDEERKLSEVNTEYATAIQRLKELEIAKDKAARQERMRALAAMSVADREKAQRSMQAPKFPGLGSKFDLPIAQAEADVRKALASPAGEMELTLEEIGNGAAAVGRVLSEEFARSAELPAATLRKTLGEINTELNLMPQGWNPVQSAIHQLSSEYMNLTQQGFSAEAIKGIRAKIEELQSPMNTFIGLLHEVKTVGEQIGEMFFNITQQLADGIGNAVAQIIVFGAKAGEVFAALGKQILATIISTLVKVAVQFLIVQAMKLIGIGNEIGALMAGYAATTYAAAFSSIAAIPIVGPGLAPGVAAAATSAMLAGAAVAGLAGAAVGGFTTTTGAAIGGTALADEGAIFTKPTLVSVDKPRGGSEIMLTKDKARKFFDFDGDGGGSGQPIYFIVDGRKLAEVMLPHEPRVQRFHGVPG
jgi:hypothetical protein